MRYLGLLAIAGLAASASVAAMPAAAAAGSTAKMVATIHQFIDAFDKGDLPGAAATHAADVTIIDEVPPHLWRGPKALASWAADLGADDKKNGMSGEAVTLGKTQRAQIDGDTGYAVIRSTFSYKQNGVDMAEAGTMTFALKSGKDGWKITAWSWNGTVPKAAAPAK
jgi:ketosteroid isomerase-like protein